MRHWLSRLISFNTWAMTSLALIALIILGVIGATFYVEQEARRAQEQTFNEEQALQTRLAGQAMEEYFRSLFFDIEKLNRFSLVQYEEGLLSESDLRERLLLSQSMRPEYLVHAYLRSPDDFVLLQISPGGSTSPTEQQVAELISRQASANWAELSACVADCSPLIAEFEIHPGWQWLTFFQPVSIDGQQRGVLVVIVDLQPIITRYIIPMRSGTYGAGYLLDGRGVVVYDHETEIIGENILDSLHAGYPDVQRMDRRLLTQVSGMDAYRFTVTRGGPITRKLIAWHTVSVGEQKLIICLAAPESEFIKNLASLNLQRNLLTAALVLMLTGSGLALYNSRQQINRRHTARLEAQVDARTAELNASREALRDSKEILQAIIDYSPLPIIMIDPQGRVTVWNPAAERFFGWSAAEIITFQRLPIIPPECDEEFERLTQKIAEGHPLLSYETVRLRRDGKRMNVIISSAVMHNASGQITGRMAIFADISDRKQREEEARIDDARLRALLRLSQLKTDTLQELLDQALDEAVELSNSEVGFLYFYNAEQQQLVLCSWSKNIKDKCAIPDRPTVYAFENTGIWGEAVRKAKPIILNDYQAAHPLKRGLPEGHVPLTRFMTLPVFSDNQIVALVGVGNKSGEYTALDIRGLELMMDSVWKLAQRKEAEIALRESEATLRKSEAQLRESEAALRESEAQLRINETFLRENETALRSSESILRQNESELRTSEAALRSSEAALRISEATLRENEVKLLHHNEHLAMLDAFSRELAGASLNCDSILHTLAHQISASFEDVCYIGMVAENDTEVVLSAISAPDAEVTRFLEGQRSSPQGPITIAIRTGQSILFADIDLEDAVRQNPHLEGFLRRFGAKSMIVAPLNAQGLTLGALALVRLPGPRPSYNNDDLALAQELANRAAMAVTNALLYENKQNKLKQFQALHSIGSAITASLELNDTLAMIVSQLVSGMQVDAADILLNTGQNQQLRVMARSGFNQPENQHCEYNLPGSPAEHVLNQGEMVYLPNLSAADQNMCIPEYFNAENFASYIGLPLTVRGELSGVLEVFQRSPARPSTEWFNGEWLSVLQTLAGQAAIAMDHAALFEELILAYDETIEGWSQAMDLRDKETEGHTRRVTSLTVELARTFGLEESDINHIRRGALLHDFGKVGVPDEILRKPGPLTDAEWAIMRKHPTFAYNMIQPIRFLRTSLDIPYCHHERWDGSGYPRGLKGEEIPLAARIFAVVDVYDALTSDRVYRLAWSAEKARDYIRAQCGKHFDPQVVEVFLMMLEDKDS